MSNWNDLNKPYQDIANGQAERSRTTPGSAQPKQPVIEIPKGGGGGPGQPPPPVVRRK